ncbi:pRL2-8 [Streptomyces sp. NBC_01530]|uniref:pRL2-8 n=1 Tax=Streptomyces sp. NBC_01530 TaxID=2903895 RepID=UPI00386B1EC9
MALRRPVPPGQCRQCWTHAYDPDIHRRLRPGQDCQPCLDHMGGNHGSQIVPKKASSWW